MKIFVNGPYNYTNWIYGDLTDSVKEADLVLFTGGSDVCPIFYEEKIHKTTNFDLIRDANDIKVFVKALSLRKKMLGVCRGAQFLCVMAGGKLVQHQDNKYTHKMHTYDNKEIEVISTHHQAQYPWNINPKDFKILAWTKNLSLFHKNGLNKEIKIPEDKECEVVLYKNINALGIQTHPEMMFESDLKLSVNWFSNILDNFINNKL